MDPFLIDVPMPSMGATISELTVVGLKVAPGARVAKGQKVAELESDKSIFEFESPCDGIVKAILANPGDIRESGTPFLRIETTDASVKHLEAGKGGPLLAERRSEDQKPAAGAPRKALVWTPRATKMAQEAGLDPASLTDIGATGPGGRVSGDDVTHYLARRKS